MNLFGICGLAGSGKDTVADFLAKEHGFAKVSFADPLKRICKDVFEFTDEQLWGPSQCRNAPDSRYPRNPYGSSVVAEYLTPRYALQTLGTEFGRDCYATIWVEYALRVVERLLSDPYATYDARTGVTRSSAGFTRGVAVPDVRFRNEVDAIVQAGGKVVRIVRPGAGLGGAAGLHPSEREQVQIPDSAFHAVIQNDGTLEDLYEKVGEIVGLLGAR